jgi:hypothetical protein
MKVLFMAGGVDVIDMIFRIPPESGPANKRSFLTKVGAEDLPTPIVAMGERILTAAVGLAKASDPVRAMTMRFVAYLQGTCHESHVLIQNETHHTPWNKGKLIGHKSPLKLKGFPVPERFIMALVWTPCFLAALFPFVIDGLVRRKISQAQFRLPDFHGAPFQSVRDARRVVSDFPVVDAAFFNSASIHAGGHLRDRLRHERVSGQHAKKNRSHRGPEDRDQRNRLHTHRR